MRFAAATHGVSCMIRRQCGAPRTIDAGGLRDAVRDGRDGSRFAAFAAFDEIVEIVASDAFAADADMTLVAGIVDMPGSRLARRDGRLRGRRAARCAAGGAPADGSRRVRSRPWRSRRPSAS
ncbi:hypothetical protein ACRUKS_31115 [Burkholderia pseudomallei]|uniref:Uncharacterized protein n=1 Tax=Burkholderia pseudomallei TaxID=28450 RepID=A0AAX0TZH8_BURPE|nr:MULTISPECIES: hypothetical protein [Burkholderia]AJW52557.1 hypothetical protein UQ47_05475 [Burkholderia pseudomallei]ALB93182.1 hypothetical protein AM256_05835 [Burkholderia pseudomallei]ALB99244.1 hypothetical protein AM257_05840 [Burkholderia pseudomallei]APD35906.1 hypothetical protein BK015_12685 [Burkholderia pseudomallei]ARK40619.1 hypothetical protein BOC60_10535 [Burkholderia pseudomallei]